jgi:hypothetical protein
MMSFKFWSKRAVIEVTLFTDTHLGSALDICAPLRRNSIGKSKASYKRIIKNDHGSISKIDARDLIGTA